ncbi:MAG TPA: hypothetical protein VNU44_18445 [Bryobacteraceae bacterium]|nr:hypothetical protein [Bryobacteraceae bacterium]
MKLEFLADGSTDCPLIRLYAFDQSSVCQLRDLIKSLAVGTRANAPLHAQPWIEPVDGCELELYLDERCRGIIEVRPSKFKLVLNDEGCADIAGLLEPFCESANPESYQ